MRLFLVIAQSVAVLSLSMIVGCSSKMIHENKSAGSEVTNKVQYDEVTESEINLLNLDIKDVPMEYRYMVVKWLDYYQGRGREHMERYLSRSTRYLPLMRATLKTNGLPEDLVYIPLIESGFSPRARSHAGAVGYWQFIRGTGRRYGLLIDQMVDERQDPIRSSESAALYFKGLYNLFGSWYLAIASYNVGENRIQRAVMTHLTRSFWELAHRRALPRETVDYVPKFIAACMIAREPEKYGFINIDFNHPFAYEIIETNKPVDLQALASLMNITYQEMKDLNPAYRTKLAVPIKGRILIRVPEGRKMAALENVEKAFSNSRRNITATSPGIYRVRRGDSLSTIAQAFGTSVKALSEENDIRQGALLKVGSLIRIPELGQKKSKRKSSSRVEHIIHKVRRGESLTSIAKRYKISVKSIIDENRLQRRKAVLVGKALRIPTEKLTMAR